MNIEQRAKYILGLYAERERKHQLAIAHAEVLRDRFFETALERDVVTLEDMQEQKEWSDIVKYLKDDLKSQNKNLSIKVL